jgi:hypothetical protein
VIAEVFPNGGYDVLAVYQHADPYVQQIPANRPRGTTLTVSVEGTVLATATICAPSTKDGCKDGGWVAFGFKNQGECVALIERGAR